MVSCIGAGARAGASPSALAVLVALLPTHSSRADDLTLIDALHDPAAHHVNQQDLVDELLAGHPEEAFELAFEGGNALFDTTFNILDGVGAHVGAGQRFTHTPRADLAGPGEWRMHIPARATGPNAASCTSCHNLPSDDGAGSAAANVHRDPLHSGSIGSFIERNTPHTFAAGAVQRLAEEMTSDLKAIRAQAGADACVGGVPVTAPLMTKGVSFGSITALPTGGDPCATFDTTLVVGCSADLVIRPFQWKGSVAFVRDFNRGAAHNELGMQAVELVGDLVDGDDDGVTGELTIGDQTALAVYLAAQPRPTSKLELALLGLMAPLTPDELSAIGRGFRTFRSVGCAECHVPRLTILDPIFSEPSQMPEYRDTVFPAGQDPLALGVSPNLPIQFDLRADQPDNRIQDEDGHVIFHLGALTKDQDGHAIVDMFGDLKRHDLGPAMAESIDEVGTGSSMFLTENLWGVGTTAPYLHDGRATTLTEAVLAHGGEGQVARDAFVAASVEAQRDLIAFLDNLVLFKLPEEEGPPPTRAAK